MINKLMNSELFYAIWKVVFTPLNILGYLPGLIILRIVLRRNYIEYCSVGDDEKDKVMIKKLDKVIDNYMKNQWVSYYVSKTGFENRERVDDNLEKFNEEIADALYE